MWYSRGYLPGIKFFLKIKLFWWVLHHVKSSSCRGIPKTRPSFLMNMGWHQHPPRGCASGCNFILFFVSSNIDIFGHDCVMLYYMWWRLVFCHHHVVLICFFVLKFSCCSFGCPTFLCISWFFWAFVLVISSLAFMLFIVVLLTFFVLLLALKCLGSF